jgi:hypothetical protein
VFGTQRPLAEPLRLFTAEWREAKCSVELTLVTAMIKRLLKLFSKASERLAADSRWQHNRKRQSRNRDFL